MYIKLHRYHWFVKGQHFFGLHQQFKKMYEETAVQLDELAERILMIGGKPLAVMTKYVEQASLQEASADDEEYEIMQQLLADYEQMSAEIREHGFELAKQCKDEPTLDVLVTLTATYEKYIWMLKAWQKENKSKS